MINAPPKPGAVIRYSYLWADENAYGREEGGKDRPVLVLALSLKADEGLVQLLVVAITHAAPAHPSDAVPLPLPVKQAIGPDDVPAWIITTEANAFIWPGPDVRPVPRRKPRTIVYGRVPHGLLAQVARSYLANRERQRSRVVPRTG